MKISKFMVVVFIVLGFVIVTLSSTWAARGCTTPEPDVFWFDAIAYDKAPGERLDVSLTAHYEDLSGTGGGPWTMYFMMKITDKKDVYPFSGAAYDIDDFDDYSQQFWAIADFLEKTALPVVLGCDPTGADPLNPCPQTCQPVPDAYPEPILCTEDDEPYFSLKSVRSWLEDDTAEYGLDSAAYHVMFMDFVIAIKE